MQRKKERERVCGKKQSGCESGEGGESDCKRSSNHGRPRHAYLRDCGSLVAGGGCTVV